MTFAPIYRISIQFFALLRSQLIASPFVIYSSKASAAGTKLSDTELMQ